MKSICLSLCSLAFLASFSAQANTVMLLEITSSSATAGLKEVNLKAIQADAAQVAAGGTVSATLAQAFATLRESAEYSDMGDAALAQEILRDIAARN